MPTIAPTSSTCSRGAEPSSPQPTRAPSSSSRRSSRSGRPDCSSSRADRRARSLTRRRTCGSATRSRRSRSPTGSSSESGRRATAAESRSCCGAFSDRIEWMGVESAELVKHGVNAFLAMSIAFANELAGIAERVGADATEVERGLKTEGRIGARAYLRPGAAFAGGTLARDIDYLTQIGEREHVPTQLLRAVRVSNDEHKQWARRDGRVARRRRERQARRPRRSGSGGSSTRRERTRCAGRARSSCAGRSPAAARPSRRTIRPFASSRTTCPASSRCARRHSRRPRRPRRSSSRRTGRRIARWTPKRLVARCGRRSSSTRTAFSATSSATTGGLRYVRVGGQPGVTGVLDRQDGDRHRREPRPRARDRTCVRRSRRSGARLRARRDGARPRSGRARVGRARARLRRDGRGRRLRPGGRRRTGRARPRTLLAHSRARQQRRDLRAEGADRRRRLGGVGAGHPGESLRLGPVQSRGVAALPGERLRQDHPALRRRRHVARFRA